MFEALDQPERQLITGRPLHGTCSVPHVSHLITDFETLLAQK